MISEWRETTIGEITDSCLGKMLDQKKNKGTYQPYLANVNVRWGDFDLVDLPLMRFEESEQERYGLRSGDIVLCEGGEPGRCAIWRDQIPNMKIQKALHRIRTHEDVNNEYLYYWFLLAGKTRLLDSYFTGTTIQHLPGEKLKSIKLRIPPINYQKKVASILACIDSKIRTNSAINDNLLHQAQAYYISIFSTNAEPNWPIGRLKDLINLKYGKDHKKLAKGSIPVYGSGGVMRYVERPLYTQESVLIPRKGTLNNIMYVNEPFWSVDTMFYSEMKRANIAKYVYHFLRGKDLASMNAGSAVPSMTTEMLNSMEIVIPSSEILAKFESIVAPMYEMMLVNKRLSSILAQYRDALLPKLMSGEIDVSDIAC